MKLGCLTVIFKLIYFCRDVLTDPVKVVQGEVGIVADTVTQEVMVVPLGQFHYDLFNSVIFFSTSFNLRGSQMAVVDKKSCQIYQ